MPTRVPPPYPTRSAAPPTYPKPTARRTPGRRPATAETPSPAANAPQVEPLPPSPPPSRPAVVFRPRGVVVIGLLGTVHAAWVLVAQLYASMLMLKATDGVTRAVLADRALGAWAVGSVIASFVLGLVQLFASIYAMSLNPWARRALVAWSASWIALTVAALAVNFAKVFPLMDQVQQHLSPTTRATSRTIAVGLAVLLGIAWPAVVWWYARRRNVVEAFGRAAEGGAVM